MNMIHIESSSKLIFNCSICITTCKTDSVVQKQINYDQDLCRRSSSLQFAINISYICISSRCPSSFQPFSRPAHQCSTMARFKSLLCLKLLELRVILCQGLISECLLQCNAMACKALRSEFGADLPLNIQIWLSLGAWPFQLFNIGHVLVTFWTRPLVLRKFGLFVVLILPPLREPSGWMKCVRWAATLCWQWQTNILHCVPSYASLSNIFGRNFMAALETFGNHFKFFSGVFDVCIGN